MPRAKVDTRQRAAFNQLAEALGEYLEAIGWRAVVVGGPRIHGWEKSLVRGMGRYEFVLEFTGGRTRARLSETPAPKTRRARR